MLGIFSWKAITMALSMTMNLFCCMKETSRRIQNFHMKTTKDSTWMRWTIRDALRFGRPIPDLSMIYVFFGLHLQRTWPQNKPVEPLVDPVSLERYAEAVYDKGAALNNCTGFIDGTVRPICRPGEFQRVVYNGHKRVHALKFQSFTLPNGMIANMYGPVGKSMVHNRPPQNCLKPFAFVILVVDSPFFFLILLQREENTMPVCWKIPDCLTIYSVLHFLPLVNPCDSMETQHTLSVTVQRK